MAEADDQPRRYRRPRGQRYGELRVLSEERAVLVQLVEDEDGVPAETNTVPLVRSPAGYGWVRAPEVDE